MIEAMGEKGTYQFHEFSRVSSVKPGANWKTFKLVIIIVIILLILNFLYALYYPKLTPIITIRDGQIQGKVGYSRNSTEYWQFLSIPFAKPPVNNLKFQPPIPIKPWVGVKPVVEDPPLCIQFDSVVTQTVWGQEDCLYLNIYAPPLKNESDPKLPVLVHVHGGGFILGGSYFYGPEYFMDHPIIVVTFNYRLGPFGFLNFEHDPKIDSVPLPRGNMGMKDQLLALKWVQNNIAHFGGDPARVAMYGESAGGVSVHLHVLSPKSRGLFHRAFSHSGAGFCDWGYTSKPREVALDYAKRINCPLNSTGALLDCLHKFDPKKLVKYQLSSTDPAKTKDNLSPSVETVQAEDRFLSEHPQDIMDSGKFSKVPYILGVNSGDGGLRTGRFDGLPDRVTMLQTNWTETIGNVLLIDDLIPSKANAIRDFYFSNFQCPQSLKEFKQNLTVLFSDAFSFEPVHRAAVGHAKSGAKTRMFYYNYTSPFLPGSQSFYSGYKPDSWFTNPYVQVLWTIATDWIKDKIWDSSTLRPYGIGHGEEVAQVWNFLGSKMYSRFDVKFSNAFVKMMVDFVHAKEPLMFGNTVWPNIQVNTGDNLTENPLMYMLIEKADGGKMVPEPFFAGVKFLESVGVINFNRNLTKPESALR